MGKGRHTQDKIHITAKEWQEHYGGKKDAKNIRNPVMTPDGAVFDLTNLIPFLRKHRINPVTGEPLAAKDCVTLHWHKNSDGQYDCPITGKVFTENSRIVAIRTTGNVYSWDAVDQMCVQRKYWKDLLNDTPFVKADIVFLQDPTNDAWLAKHNINTFFHVRAKNDGVALPSGSTAATAAAGVAAEVAGAGAGAGAGAPSTAPDAVVVARPGVGTIRMSEAAKRVLAEADKEEEARRATAKRKREEAGPPEPGSEAAQQQQHVTGYGVKTSGRYSGSLTSSAMPVLTHNEAAQPTPLDLREARWAAAKALGKKAYVQLVTSAGPINLELHVDIVPMTCDNFLTLAARGYYNGTVFHRIVKNFMIQGGDKTGTGRGGLSCWDGGKRFKDEFHKSLKHSERGILSMANAGPDTNTSQFFITLKEASHLDRKHSVFGRVVGGMDTLRELELIPVDSDDRPKDIGLAKLEEVKIFQNPFDELPSANDIAEKLKTAGATTGRSAAGATGSVIVGAGASIAARASAGIHPISMPGTLDDVAALRAAKEQEDMETFFAERARKAAAPAMADIGPVGKYLPLPPAATPAPAPAPSSASSSAAPKPATSAQPTSAASVSNVPVASSRSFALPLPKASSAGGFGNFDKW